MKNNQGAAGLVFESANGKSSYDAIVGVTKTPFRGKCLSALEMTIFYVTANVIGQDRFNKVYPDGLHLLGLPGNDPGISIYRNVETQFDNITAAAMVPGDWATCGTNPTTAPSFPPESQQAMVARNGC